MSKYTLEQVHQVVRISAIYSSHRPDSFEDVRIDYTEEDSFVGTGEETGRLYRIYFEDIDLNQDSFQCLVPVDVSQVLTPKQ